MFKEEEKIYITLTQTENQTPLLSQKWNKFNFFIKQNLPEIKAQILYPGNISDLWEWLKTQIHQFKDIFDSDYQIMKISVQVAKVYFLWHCKNSINPKDSKGLRKSLKQQVSKQKEEWLQELVYSEAEIMRSNFFEMTLRNHSFFGQSKARKDIIGVIAEMRFSEDNNEKIKRYFWMLLERIRKVISEQQKTKQLVIVQYIVVLLICCICYPSYTSLVFSHINIQQHKFSHLVNLKGSEGLISQLKEMEQQKLIELYKKLLKLYFRKHQN